MPWGVSPRNLLGREPGLPMPGRTGLPGEKGGAERAHASLALGSGGKFLVGLVCGDRTAGRLTELEGEPRLPLSQGFLPPLSWATAAG